MPGFTHIFAAETPALLAKLSQAITTVSLVLVRKAQPPGKPLDMEYLPILGLDSLYSQSS